MAETEITALRRSHARTLDLGGGARRFECGGAIAHHKVGGLFIPTDTTWKDLTTTFASGDYPQTLSFVKSSRTLTIGYGNGDTITLSPRNGRTPSSVTMSGNTVQLVRLWTGITLKLILAPEGVCFHYIKTATTYTNPAYDISGPWEQHYGPCRYEVGIETTVVPQTIASGVLTYDFSAVPLNVEVS